MTTRAGLTGIISGISISIIANVLLTLWTGAVVHNGVFFELNRSIETGLALLLIISGYWAAKWNRSTERWRCIALGSLAGIVAMIILFGLWGAAFSAIQLSSLKFIPVSVMIQFTIAGFFRLLFIGGLSGAVGGYFYHPTKTVQKDIFNKDEPQMAMNASITAVSASLVAVAIAASTFPNLSGLTGNSSVIQAAYLFPLYAALVLLVLSHFALTLVVPHETKQAEHVSGMDEVKMAAFVSIAASPLLILLLAVIDIQLLGDLFVIILLVPSIYMSAYSVRSLVKFVIPKRNSYPKHSTKGQATQAALFGSIAKSKAWRLITLCIGCGMAMVFPIYIAVLAPLTNINAVTGNAEAILLHSVQIQNLFWMHIKISMGINLIVILVLCAMYIFYLNLGKWYRKQYSGK